MSINSTHSKSQCKVVSKYFSRSPVMDESLSEFKEKKAGYTGPKKSQKPVVNKTKPRNAPKRIKGQKDIRTALKSKKNELLAYAEEFDVVCRKSGIDVDTEQLQLVIALSKSVQSTEDDNNSPDLDTQPASSQERTKRIRTTLKEYGFVVPEVKITNKRQRKRVKKNYKLISATEEEKQQIISDKYAQLLFENVCESTVIDCKIHSTGQKYYNLATSISYIDMKNNDVLYVENLLERSHSSGCLLRDWSNIPGRPQSPKTCETVKMNFSEIECSQEELDIVLSGTLKSAKSIALNKITAAHKKAPILVYESAKTGETKNKSFDKNNETGTLVDGSTSFLTTSDRVRSCSPDIFDDEVSAVYDTTNSCSENCKSVKESVTDLTQDGFYERNINKTLETSLSRKEDVMNLMQTKNIQNNKNKPIMDLTEITDTGHNNAEYNSNIIVSQSSTNFTKRQSNDFMEITECVVVSSELVSNTNSCKTNNSQLKNKTTRMTYDFMEITECVGKTQSNSVNMQNNIDLTQSSDESNDENLVNAKTIVKSVVDVIVDISQSSHSDEELPFVQISGSNNHSLDETILLDNDEIMIKTNPLRSSDHEINVENVDKKESISDSIDQIESPPTPKNDTGNKLGSHEFVYHHSDKKFKETSDKSTNRNDSSQLGNNINFTQSDAKTSNANNDEESVDLTQSSNSFDGTEDITNISTVYTPAKSGLGKKDNVSVDYDELFDDIAKAYPKEDSKSGHSFNQSESYDHNETVSESQSRNSEVFDISDKEFEYSMNQSRNNFPSDGNFGEISFMENVPKHGNENRDSNIEQPENNHSMNRSMSDSYLPMVNIKKHIPIVKVNLTNQKDIRDKDGSSEPVSCNAFAKDNAFTTTDTPTSNKYIVKTDQVTPMLDYASMSTPERNRELDKYGLKPFKRKRAIQLLTHLYNQTHPIVETCQEDLPSPSKKRRYSSQPSSIKLTSPNKLLKSPSKSLKSPSKYLESADKFVNSSKNSSQNEPNPELNEDGNVYEVTNELPVIKDISTLEEDWIFQKREKSKLHSCRVPLHIALHNYVSCRQKLREAILKYKPVNIDVIHKELVASGHRYDPKDLLKYLDKKCITVKTADNNARNTRR